MKVSLPWLKELVKYDLSDKELADKLSLSSIGIKDQTPEFLELDLTYNRGDLLSMRGVAREVAAITNSEVAFEDHPFPKYDLLQTPVKIEDLKLSPIQIVAKIENLRFEDSNETWIKKLSDCGMRTVNNIVDVTNLIMLEFGQPLHAFDQATVKDNTINVRLARQGEEITTLDGKLRKLDASDIVLADSEKPLDVAGVMGGKDTEIKDSTTTILLSASMFNPTMVRKTAQRLGLHSEASKRFQHSLTKTNLLQAIFAAIKMYKDIGGKLTAITLTGDLEDKPKTIELTQEKINNLIGIEIVSGDVEKYLNSLNFTLEAIKTGWQVTVPYWRLDINIEEDLIEEVARMYGYEKIPPQKLRGKLPAKIDQSLQKLIYNLKTALVTSGLTEVQSYSFYSTQTLKALGWTDKLASEHLVKIANPISSETEYMRQNIWPNLVEVVGKNLKQGYKDIAVFEIGKVYYPKKGDLPEEKYHLAIALINNSDNPIRELAAIYQDVKLVHPKSVQLGDRNLFHPVRFTDIMAEVHPRVLHQYGIDKRVAILEIDLEPTSFFQADSHQILF